MVSQGEKAPTFTLPDTDRKPRSVNEFLKPNSATVLAFFPGAFTTVSTREMCTLRDNMQELNKINAQVVGISVNDPFTNKAFAQNNNLNFPILSDFNREVVKLYNVFHENRSEERRVGKECRSR